MVGLEHETRKAAEPAGGIGGGQEFCFGHVKVQMPSRYPVDVLSRQFWKKVRCGAVNAISIWIVSVLQGEHNM